MLGLEKFPHIDSFKTRAHLDLPIQLTSTILHFNLPIFTVFATHTHTHTHTHNLGIWKT